MSDEAQKRVWLEEEYQAQIAILVQRIATLEASERRCGTCKWFTPPEDGKNFGFCDWRPFGPLAYGVELFNNPMLPDIVTTCPCHAPRGEA